MKEKKEKKTGISSEHREALALLAGRPEFKALEALVKIHKNNILVSVFKIPASDPQLNLKKAAYEGQMFMLKSLMKTFEESKKEE